MKELIEKIKALKSNDGTFISIGYDKAINKVLELIEEQENYPFLPIELGFTKVNGSVFNRCGYKKEFILEQMRIRHEWRLTVVFESGFNSDALFLTIKNQRQGKEILQSLGII
jgi:hypothetical protein